MKQELQRSPAEEGDLGGRADPSPRFLTGANDRLEGSPPHN